MSTEKLLLDLGGTNLRVGYGNDENLTSRDVSKVRVDSNEDIFKVVNNSINGNNISEIVFSAAGPRIENKISMTNRSLDLDGDLLANELKIKNCFLLNDWESIGYSLPLMTTEDISTVKDGDIRSCQGSKSIRYPHRYIPPPRGRSSRLGKVDLLDYNKYNIQYWREAIFIYLLQYTNKIKSSYQKRQKI